MNYKTLTESLTRRGALIALVLAVLTLAAVFLAYNAYAAAPPPAPTNLTGSASEDGIVLSWTAPNAEGITGYQILRRLTADDWDWSKAVYVNDTGNTDTSYTDTDVEAGEEYRYRVKARYGDETGRWSNGVDIRAAGGDPEPTPEPTPTPEPGPPPAPTNLTGAASANGITLSWTAPDAAGITGYQILRRLTADGWDWSKAVYVDDTGSTDTGYTDTGVVAGKEYHYRVKGRNGDEIGRWSNGINVQAIDQSPDATLSNLELSGVNFGTFDSATTGYTASVGNDVEQTTVTATTNDDGASYVVKLGGVEDADRTVALAVGANVITVEVTAEDGNTTKTYTITVTRAETPPSTDATLSGLTLSNVNFGTFDSAATNYTASVAHEVEQTTVTATANDDGASYVVKLGTVADADETVDLAVGANAVSIVVTAEDGNTTQTYTVTVTRAQAPGPGVGISLSSDYVETGTAITVTLSFSNLETDSDDSTKDYIFRADVKDSQNGDADACEDQANGNGLGVDRPMWEVDEDPEIRTGTISADCPAGDYTVRASLSDPENNPVASASADFTVAEPLPPAIAVALNPSSEEGTEIAVAMSFGNLKPDSDSSTVDYVFRADVKDSGNADADGCEGDGMGADRDINEVDQDPETRTGAVSADCPAGDYKVEVAISDAGNNRLASARANFTITEPKSSKKATRGEPEPRIARQTACDAIWCATLTVGYLRDGTTDFFGWDAGALYPGGALSETQFDYDGGTYYIHHIVLIGSPATDLKLFFADVADGDIETQATRNKLSFHVGNDVFKLEDGTYSSSQKGVTWSNPNLTWADRDTVALKIYATPELKRATVDGGTLAITFNTHLDDASEPAGSAFTVNVAGSPVAVTRVAVSGQTATLTLGSPVTFGQAVTVSYAKPASGPLQNPAGTDAPAFSGETVFNHTLSAPCDALWCAVMRVGEYPQGVPPQYGWFGQGVLGGDLSDVDFTHDGDTYELDQLYSANQIRTLYLLFSDTEYGDIDNSATRNRLKLYFGEEALNLGEGTYTRSLKRITFSNVPLTWSAGGVVELSIDDRPVLESAVVVGDTMTLTFDRALDGASEPAPSAFTLLIDGRSGTIAVSGVAISSTTVTLTLAEAVTFDQTVTVNYSPPNANPLQGGGRSVAAFVNRAVTNNTCPALWCATLTVDEQTGSFGWSSGPEFAQARLTDDRFNFAGNEYQLDEIAFRDSDNRLTLSFSGFNAGDIDNQNTRIRLAVDIEGAVLNLGEGTYSNSTRKSVTWTQDVAWTDGQTIHLKIVEVLGPILSISPSASPIKEAGNARATFTVTRSHLTSVYTTAHLGYTKTGNYFNCDHCGPATDEARQNEGELPLSPVFHPGETTRTVSFRVHDDYEFELPGSVTLFLRPPTTPGNEYEIDPAGQSATVEVHSHGYGGGPLGLFGDQYPPILAHIEVPPVPENHGQYRVYVHLRMAPSVSFAGRTYRARITEDMPIPPSFSFTISTRGQLARPTDDYNALSHAVLSQQRECSPPTVVNAC